MRKIVLMLAVLLIVTSWGVINADIHLEIKYHGDSYYYGGVNTPAVDESRGQWIGEKKTAVISGKRVTVLDLEKKRLLFINHQLKIYAEAALPLDFKTFMEEQFAAQLERYPWKGTVKATGETKKIKHWNCKAYVMENWIDVPGGKYNEREIKIWVTKDFPPPFDVKVFSQLNGHYVKFANYHDDLIAALEGVPGYPVLLENTNFGKGFSWKARTEVVSISEEKPPPGIYSVPEGYKKKEKLSPPDLQG